FKNGRFWNCSITKLTGGSPVLPPPVDCRPSSCARLDSRGRLSPHKIKTLRGLAGALAFERLLAAHVDLDLLGLGFGLLGKSDLQHALVVVGRNLLGIYGVGKGEGAGKAAILALHTTVVLFLLFLFDLALAVHGEGVVLDAYIDVFLVDARDFDLQGNGVLVFVNIDCRREA